MSNRDPNWAKYERRILAACIANLLVFGLISVFIGGDAVNGFTQNGVYYLSAHGEDTAVPPLVWYYSLTHARITIISFLLMFAYGIIRNLTVGRPDPS